jgi:hypothetical protein
MLPQFSLNEPSIYTANPFPVMKTRFRCVHISTLLSLQGSCFQCRDIPACSLFYTVCVCVRHQHFLGGGVKNWSNLLTDSSKTLPTEGGEG